MVRSPAADAASDHGRIGQAHCSYDLIPLLEEGFPTSVDAGWEVDCNRADHGVGEIGYILVRQRE